MLRIASPLAVLVTVLAACSAPVSDPTQHKERSSPTADPSKPTADAIAAAPVARPSPAGRVFTGSDGLVTLTYPVPLTPSTDFAGAALMTSGWRLMWDGRPAGPGTPVARIAQDARPADGIGYVTESVQVGLSRDPAVVARCGTDGLAGNDALREPNRMLGGHRWTVWHHTDAGMSQSIDATDWRTVVDGVCYAIARVSYAVKAGDPKPGLPPQREAATRIDAALASIHVGGR